MFPKLAISVFRDTSLGFFIRFLDGNRLLRFPEDIPGFVPPFLVHELAGDDSSTPSESDNEKPVEEDSGETRCSRRGIDPVKSKDGVILVDWYSTDDPDNPLLTFTVYYGSSAYAPAIPFVMEKFDCSEANASLGLAIYVIGYGFGPLLWSPLSEIPTLGRNALYIATMFIFTLLIIPTALTDSLPAFVVARFLCAFFGSPPLSTSPASFTEMVPLDKLPYVLAMWSGLTTLAPALGPIIAGYTLQSKDWHCSMFELLWLASPGFVLLFCLLPETSTDNILLRRAARLRLVTGNPNYRSQSEIKQATMTRSDILFNAIIKPREMNILDPAILFSTIYVALLYAIFYPFFEAFPMVFSAMHGFLLELRNGPPVPEFWLRMSLVVSALAPIGLFVFAWTVSPDIHCIVPLSGVVLFQAAA
ncbi:major facilitator superfamily domain-containing protein [Clohesyomyces aquaticus]|uniref:Major facilitator superfamily domain-containing protein n=1 Tax=Clohesyomyces aquaticus TaxID=1231657 RepID=A0A1Y1YC83_9PLEO|nr:major facilitator superfamily domain-containing protein [Clohesyomyces aquaticus]